VIDVFQSRGREKIVLGMEDPTMKEMVESGKGTQGLREKN
jgi:hypothetical protein